MRPVVKQEELEKIFAARTEKERARYITYLLTGFRDKKVRTRSSGF